MSGNNNKRSLFYGERYFCRNRRAISFCVCLITVSYTHLDVYKRQALYWYRRSAEGGNGDSMCNLGRCYKRGDGVEQNWQEAIKWYEQGAQCGNLQSMHNLACCYERGEGVEQNEDRALYWYRRSAEGGKDVYKRQQWR